VFRQARVIQLKQTYETSFPELAFLAALGSTRRLLYTQQRKTEKYVMRLWGAAISTVLTPLLGDCLTAELADDNAHNKMTYIMKTNSDMSREYDLTITLTVSSTTVILQENGVRKRREVPSSILRLSFWRGTTRRILPLT
jgi:hypothetical protein